MCSFRTIARILRKLELPRPFFKNSKFHKITNRTSIIMKIVTIKGLWLLYWRTKFHIDISSHLWVIGISNVENRTHTHTRAHAHTSGRQLKITFLEVLDYSEYSDTNITKINFCTKTASSVRKQKRFSLQAFYNNHFRLKFYNLNVDTKWIITVAEVFSSRFFHPFSIPHCAWTLCCLDEIWNDFWSSAHQ